MKQKRGQQRQLVPKTPSNKRVVGSQGSTNPASSRNLEANVHKFITEYLGKPVPDFGKAAVMNLAHSEFAPSFNKFSGVAEWKNCLFLWVNVGGDDYANMFLDEGERLTWFGGSKMHADSPVTQRLLKARMEQKEADATSAPETVLLFCRLPGEPYTCLGRLQCDLHDLSKFPLQFTWRLLDFSQLCGKSRIEHFQQFLTASAS